MRLVDTSRVLHDLIYTDASQSLCARAWALRETYAFWAAWVMFFGKHHCRTSWDYYHSAGQAGVIAGADTPDGCPG